MSFVELDRPRPGVTLVTLNRPERRNSMAFDVMVPLRDALAGIGRDNDTRVVVVTGAGSSTPPRPSASDWYRPSTTTAPSSMPASTSPIASPPSAARRWS